MLTKTPEREKYMVFSEGILRDPYCLYYSMERFHSFEWNNWEDLKNYTIGVVNGFNYGKKFEDAVRKYNIKTEAVPKDIMNVEKLVKGRLDLIILNKRNASSIMLQNSEFKEKINASEKIIYESHYKFAFSKKSAFVSRIPEINEIIREIRMDGTLERILKEYREHP